MFIFLITTVLTLIVLISWFDLINDSKKTNVKGPWPLPIIGNGHLFLGDSSDFLKKLSQLAEKYGDAVRMYILSNRYVVLSHPKYIEPLVSSTELITKGRAYQFLRVWIGYGLLTSTGERWRSQRKFLTPALHYNILQTFLPIFIKNGNILINKLNKLADGTPVNLFPVVALAALDNVTEAIMGVSFDAQKYTKSKYVKAIEFIGMVVSMRLRNPFAADDTIFNLLPLKREQDKRVKLLHDHTKRIIAMRREELKKLNISSLSHSSEHGLKNKHGFLDLLLLADFDGKKMDDESVREQVDTFMFEGHDTTTSGIAYTLYCIAKHKEVQSKVYEEQVSIFGDDMEREPTFTELQQMKYLDLVIKETLRIYPSVPLVERAITKNTELAGLKLLKGTTVMINIFHMHRNPDVFEDPLEFRPERFEQTLKNPYSWIPFSAGLRNCIGQKFALLEMKVTVCKIIKHFKLSAAGDEPIVCGDVILRSLNGVNVVLTSRL